MSVTRCVCHSVTFRELIDLARRLDPRGELSEDVLLGALTARTGCATGCGTCRPYLCRALRTGEASQPVMDARQNREIESRLD